MLRLWVIAPFVLTALLAKTEEPAETGFDGTWSGEVSPGRAIVLRIKDGAVESLRLEYRFPGGCVAPPTAGGITVSVETADTPLETTWRDPHLAPRLERKKLRIVLRLPGRPAELAYVLQGSFGKGGTLSGTIKYQPPGDPRVCPSFVADWKAKRVSTR
ncbi:MAG: hypothetical protein LAN63_17585 [Acidobacteriia bacterium]|nr:hypothetical protein [Terriglobia bacterium]